MNAVDQAIQTQLTNIQTKTGRTLPELFELLAGSGLEKHGQLRDWLKSELGLGHGDANTLVHVHLAQAEAAKAPASADPVAAALEAIYTGGKAPLRPLQDRVMSSIAGLGDFEVSPKKTYLSLRRKKQFAMVGPGSRGRLEVGLNMKGVEAAGRLEALPPGGMCQYRVFLSAEDEVDEELLGWLEAAYQAAG